MDYTDDQCLALFTTGQAARMKYVMENYRAAMLPVITNIDQEELKNIVVYPNPNSTKQISLSKHVDVASIIDMQGRVVKSVNNTTGFSFSNEINTGLYFLKLEMNGHTNITKLSIE